MRVFTKGLLAAIFMIMITSFGSVLMSSRVFLDQPIVHVIQEGEYLSQLAQKYYGNAEYWRALALINRAPNADKVYPGEHVILPSAGAISRIVNAQRLSEVNEIVGGQEQIAKLESPQESASFASRQPQQKQQPAGNGTVVSEQATKPAAQKPANGVTGEMAEAETSVAAETPAPALQQQPASEPEVLPGIEPQQAEGGINWFWPAVILLGMLIVGLAYIYVRSRRNREDDLEIDATAIDEREQRNRDDEFEESRRKLETMSSDDVFKPVKRERKNDYVVQ